MALAVNARFLTQPLSGVQRYARELLTALDRRLAADHVLAARVGPVTAWYPANATLADPPDWSVIRAAPLNGGTGHYWEQFALARAVQGQGLLSLCGSGPLSVRRQFLVIHDANIFDLPQAFSTGYRIFHRRMRRQLAARVAGLGTVSQAAAAALAPHLRIDPARFAIVPNSADHVLSLAPDPGILARAGLRAGAYFLTVGNQSPNKNIARLATAHARLPGAPVLAVAGGYAPGVAAQGVAEGAGLRLLGRVSDGELRSLYAGALAFVWPSRSEGFGIPPLEAMALGVPVLSSDTTAMPEVLGDTPLYFDPDDTAAMTATLGAFLGMTDAARAAMIAKGHARARLFGWDASVERLIGALERAQILSGSALEIRGTAPGDIDGFRLGN